MKELSIEEKAKAYDNIIEKANKMYHENCEACQICIEELIPELKENEDERIRKEIQALVIWSIPFRESGVTKDSADKMIAWLEKQGEQRPVEPKFRVGDTVKAKTMDHFVFTIKDITDKQYVDTNGGKYDIEGQDYLELVEQNSAWSEEDENRFKNLVYLVEHSDEGKATKEGFVKFINRLKSIGPQNKWKPSDEQMEVLLSEVLAWTKGCPKQIVLESLYQDLKKLREE